MKMKSKMFGLIFTILLLGGVTSAYAAPNGGNQLQISTVSTTGSLGSPPFQAYHGVQYMAGLWWVFYYATPNLVYSTSSDGLTWAAPITITAHLYDVNSFAVAYDGSTFVYTTTDYTTTLSLFFRAATPNTDGTFTWKAAEQTVQTGAAGKPVEQYISIALDTAGLAWIVGRYKSDGAAYTPWIWWNTKTDGTWVTAGGFPYQEFTSDTFIGIQPMLGGKMAFYDYSNTGARSNMGFTIYNGGWVGRSTSGISQGYPSNVATVGYNDHIYTTCRAVYTSMGGAIYHYSWSGGWEGGATGISLGAIQAQSFTLLASTGICLTWCSQVPNSSAYSVYYRATSGQYLSYSDWVITPTINLINVGYGAAYLTTTPDDSSGYIGVFYLNGSNNWLQFFYFKPSITATPGPGGLMLVGGFAALLVVAVLITRRRK
jgi:hypothetical protein